jgi:predicted transcriptional regulator
MSALSIRLPDSLHQRVRELAIREGISINQLIAAALAEKMSAIMTVDYLEARANRGTREKYLAALARVPDVAPEPWDRIDTHKKRIRRSGTGSRPSNTTQRSKVGNRRR